MDCGATIKMEPDAEEPVTMNADIVEDQNNSAFALSSEDNIIDALKSDPELQIEDNDTNDINGKLSPTTCESQDGEQTVSFSVTNLETNSDTRIYRCGHCPKLSTDKAIILNHLIQHTMIGQTITNMVEEQNFQTQNGVENSLNCRVETICNATIKNEPELLIDDSEEYCQSDDLINDNQKSDKKIRTLLECNLCLKTFTKKYLLRKHLPTHAENRPAKCNICTKFLKAKGSKTTYQKRPPEEQPNSCDYCSKLFCKETALIAHMKKVHKIKSSEKLRSKHSRTSYKCYVCFRTFKLSWQLRKHMRGHVDDRPIKCDVCIK